MVRSADDAIAWGRKQIDRPAEDFERECLRFVRLAFDVPIIIRDAGKAWDASQTKHVVRRGVEIPRGVPVHFELASEADHVALSLGDGRCLTNDFKRKGRIDEASIDAIYNKWGATRLGWTEDVNGVKVYNVGKAPGPIVKPRAQATVFGADTSHHQHENGLRIGQLADQGYRFVALKCTQGTGYVDPTYETALAQAEKNRVLTVAYHFLEHGNAEAQARNLAAHIIDRSIPVMLDTEPSGRSRPTMVDVNAFTVAAIKLGLTITLDYLPEWYWTQLGRPSLVGRRLVASGYPSSRHDYGSRLYPGNADNHWHAYGGQVPTIWQFTSTGKIDGYAGNVDLDAFRGSLDDLKLSGLFKDWGTPAPPPPVPQPAGTIWNLQFNSQHTDTGLAASLQLRDTVRLADVIGLNEIESPWQRALLKTMTRYAMFPTVGSAAAVPILWNKRRFRLLDSGSVKTMNGVKGITPTRWINWVRLADTHTGKRFTRVNLQLPHHYDEGGKARVHDQIPGQNARAMRGLHSLRAVLQEQAKSGPVIWGGDLNVDALAEQRLAPGQRTLWFPLTLLGGVTKFDLPSVGTHGNRLIDWTGHTGQATPGTPPRSSTGRVRPPSCPHPLHPLGEVMPELLWILLIVFVICAIIAVARGRF